MSTNARLLSARPLHPPSWNFATLAVGMLALCLQAGCAATTRQDSALINSKPSHAPGGIRVRVHAPDLDTHSMRPGVIYLSTGRVTPDSPESSPLPERVVEIGRIDDQLTPNFIVAAVGQDVNFRIVDDIHHHIFSKSESGAFDLGALGYGESRRISFDKPGMLHLYCALHPSEGVALYISPSPEYSRIASGDEILLNGLEPGSYQLHAWTESKSIAVLEVEVRPGAISAVVLRDRFAGAR